MKKLSFGTGGMRGIMGEGEDKMNARTVSRLTKAIALWVKEKGGTSVAIAYDSRANSLDFADISTDILSRYGLMVYIYDRDMPTPALSYMVRQNYCDAGIMITASHNKAEYNGYKVYNSYGAQIGEEDAKKIVELMDEISYEDALEVKSAEEERNGEVPGIINYLTEDEMLVYINEVLHNRTLRMKDALKNVSIVYTPLNGSGYNPVRLVFHYAELGKMHVVKEQILPTGKFETCPYPNPEKEEALELGLNMLSDLLETENPADALFATDPDGDRLGVAIVTKNKEIRILTGNEVGVLFLDYLIQNRVKSGVVREPIVYSTIVSTMLTEAMCKKNGVEFVKTLTGFKHMCGKMTELEKQGKLHHFLFAFEESIGYLPWTYTMDKDGVGSALLFAEIISYHKRAGKTVDQRLEELYEEYGYYGEKTLDFVFDGEDGTEKMKAIMAHFRSMDLDKDKEFVAKVDYLNDDTGLPKSDVIELQMESGALIVRPSGTEPKIKFYILIKADTKQLRDEKIRKFEDYVKESLFGDKKKNRDNLRG